MTLAGFYDPDPARADEICRLYGCACFNTLDELMDRADAMTVAAPTSLHVEIGERCLKRGLHLLMEKPLAHDLARCCPTCGISSKGRSGSHGRSCRAV